LARTTAGPKISCWIAIGGNALLGAKSRWLTLCQSHTLGSH